MTKLYPWLQQAYDHFEHAYVHQTLQHGTLFAGIAGQGRLALCRSIASMLLCTSGKPPKPCGICTGCRLVGTGGHPDYICIGEDTQEANISIEQVRSMIDQLTKKPHQGFNRVVIIHQAHRLNAAAANALLKSLEEPPEDTYMLLTSSQPYRLPATIRSRLQLYFLPVPKEDKVIPWLAHEGRLSQNQAGALLARAELAPLLALRLIDDDHQTLRSALQVAIDHSRHNTGSFGSLIEDLNRYPPIEVLLQFDNWICEILRHSMSGCGISAANADLTEWIEGLCKGLQCRAAFRLRDKVWRAIAMIEAQMHPNIVLLYIDCFFGLPTLWKRDSA